MSNFKVNQKMYCHTPVYMIDDNRPVTRAGVFYTIIRVNGYKFYIIDDENDSHSFQIDDYEKWFTNINKERKQKLLKLNQTR